jgi:hypothetical protein
MPFPCHAQEAVTSRTVSYGQLEPASEPGRPPSRQAAPPARMYLRGISLPAQALIGLAIPTAVSGHGRTRAPPEWRPRPESQLGPRWGRRPPEDHGQQRLATVSRSRRSADVSERSSRSPEHPDCLSHGGSQGFKSPHLHPKLAGQSVVGVNLAALPAGCGRAAAASARRSPARKALSGQVTRPWAAHDDHAA